MPEPIAVYRQRFVEPDKRIKGWRKRVWPSAWIGKTSELLEPLFFIPTLILTAWVFVLLRNWLAFDAAVIAVLSTILAVGLISGSCVAWVWCQQRGEVNSTAIAMGTALGRRETTETN